MSNNRSLPTPIRSLPLTLPGEFRSDIAALEEQASKEAQLREYWKIVLKHRSILIGSVAIFSLLGLLWAFTATPMYTAGIKIRINTYEPVLAATKVESVLHEKSKESNYLQTQIQEIKSYSIADAVLNDEYIRSHLFNSQKQSFFSRLFGGGAGAEDLGHNRSISGYQNSLSDIEAYLRTIKVSPVRRTSLVVISSTVDDPRLAAKIANTHARSYMDWVRDKWVEQQSHSLEFLKRQSQELRERVVSLERDMAEYAEDNSIIAVNKDENITAQKMSQLNELLTRITGERIEAENRYKEASESIGNGAVGIDDEATRSTRAELSLLEGEYQQMSAKFTPAYPRMKQLKAQIAGLKESLQGARERLLAGLQATARSIAAEEVHLKEELEKQKSMAFDLSRRQVQYNVMARDLTSSRDLLQNVLRQIEETALAVEGKSSNVSIIDNAVVPQRPSYPNKKILVLIGIIAGLSIGLSGAFLLSYLDNTISHPDDLTQLLGLPNLGVVPTFEEALLERQESQKQLAARDGLSRHPVAASSNSNSPVVFIDSPQSLASEAYRTIRTGILLSQAGEPPRTILLTSAQSSEGKTTSSINLAACLASAGAKVALVEADLRRPGILKTLGISCSCIGIVEVITGQAALAEVPITNALKRIAVYPSGKIPPNPAELLGSIEMATMIDQLSALYDYVVIDSAPVLPVTDSVILSRYVDGVVLVTQGSATPKKIIKDARDRLISVGARLIGTILNDVSLKGGDYYYYNQYYSSYYNHKAQEDEVGNVSVGL